ncbi:hypothetical protein BDZ88DRAFT_229482 [Geranomyces variabilis]|nr:hypothetical protein BDZ88DRAFT_229482 [Geranomyces variabilis]
MPTTPTKNVAEVLQKLSLRRQTRRRPGRHPADGGARASTCSRHRDQCGNRCRSFVIWAVVLLFLWALDARVRHRGGVEWRGRKRRKTTKPRRKTTTPAREDGSATSFIDETTVVAFLQETLSRSLGKKLTTTRESGMDQDPTQPVNGEAIESVSPLQKALVGKARFQKSYGSRKRKYKQPSGIRQSYSQGRKVGDPPQPPRSALSSCVIF